LGKAFAAAINMAVMEEKREREQEKNVAPSVLTRDDRESVD